MAICTDGQNLQYNQTVGGNGFPYLKGNNQPSGGLQMARLQRTFYNGTAICGTVPGNGAGSAATGGHPITRLCANRSRNIIYILYKHRRRTVLSRTPFTATRASTCAGRHTDSARCLGQSPLRAIAIRAAGR